MFAGFGTAEDTNARFKDILRNGGTGLSTAFDMPTLMGRDSDSDWALGEVGRAGVAVDTLADMEDLFADIDLGEVSTSMTINGPAPIVMAMYIALAEKNGVDHGALSGTIQNDIFKEYQAQKEYIFPPRPSVRLVTDMMRFTTAEMPRWHPVSISGYHIREAGSTAAQELAFTLANGFAYVEAAVAAGLDVDEFAPRLSFFFNAHSDFFEEIGKFRAARRIWARWMKERYGATDPKSQHAALPHPDRRRVAHRPAAREQHRPGRHPGAVGGARRHPVAAHRQLRRGARPPDRGGGPHRPAHPADRRPRDRRDQRGRPARRLALRRVDDRRDGAPGRGDLRPPRRARRRLDPRGRVRRHRRTATSSARSPTRPTGSSARSTPASASSSASTPSPTATTTSEQNLLRVDPATEELQLKRLADGQAGPRRRAPSPPRSTSVRADGRRPDDQHDAGAHRRRAGLRHRGRDRAAPSRPCSAPTSRRRSSDGRPTQHPHRAGQARPRRPRPRPPGRRPACCATPASR